MKGDLTKAILAEVEAFPGRTAYEITHAIFAGSMQIRQQAATVSGILARLAKQERVRRLHCPGRNGGVWRYEPVAK